MKRFFLRQTVDPFTQYINNLESFILKSKVQGNTDFTNLNKYYELLNAIRWMKETAVPKYKNHFPFFLNYLIRKLELVEQLRSFDNNDLKNIVSSSTNSFRKSPSRIKTAFDNYNDNNPYNESHSLSRREINNKKISTEFIKFYLELVCYFKKNEIEPLRLDANKNSPDCLKLIWNLYNQYDNNQININKFLSKIKIYCVLIKTHDKISKDKEFTPIYEKFIDNINPAKELSSAPDDSINETQVDTSKSIAITQTSDTSISSTHRLLDDTSLLIPVHLSAETDLKEVTPDYFTNGSLADDPLYTIHSDPESDQKKFTTDYLTNNPPVDNSLCVTQNPDTNTPDEQSETSSCSINESPVKTSISIAEGSDTPPGTNSSSVDNLVSGVTQTTKQILDINAELKFNISTSKKEETEEVKSMRYDNNLIKISKTQIDVELSDLSNPAVWSYLITALSIQEGIKEKPKRIKCVYFPSCYVQTNVECEYKFDSETLNFLDQLDIKPPSDYNNTRFFSSDSKKADSNAELLKVGGTFTFTIKYIKSPYFSQGSAHIFIDHRQSSQSASGWGTAITRFIVDISLKNPLIQGNILSDTSWSSHVFHLKMGMVPTKEWDSLQRYFLTEEKTEEVINILQTFIELPAQDCAQLDHDELEQLESIYRYIRFIPQTQKIPIEELFNQKQIFIDLLTKGFPYLTHDFNNAILNALNKSIGKSAPNTESLYCINMKLSKEGLEAWKEDLNGTKKFQSLIYFPQLKMTPAQQNRLQNIYAQHEAELYKLNTSPKTPGA